LLKEESVYKRYTYLAEYFTLKGYSFISIQHDILGDNDGLETVDPKAIQDEARQHLYIRGTDNILFIIESLKQQSLSLRLDKFILAGHSNGGDIAKYFTALNPSLVDALILFDARRAKLRPASLLPVLSCLSQMTQLQM